MVDREQLEGISGRSRSRQLELARLFGLEDYPSPASGCLLTDVGYSNRLRDLLAHTDRISFDDLNLLKAGRHFRLDDKTKVIVGRNEQDNNILLAYKRPDHLHLEALDVGSPVTLLVGDATEENIAKAAGITARYCSARTELQVEVSVMNGDKAQRSLLVTPAREEKILAFALR
jgi:hypothetical protein